MNGVDPNNARFSSLIVCLLLKKERFGGAWF